jgi:hypothetical protein
MSNETIIRKIDTLDISQRTTVLLLMHHMGCKLIQHADGTRIDLNACTVGQIQVISLFLKELAPISAANKI